MLFVVLGIIVGIVSAWRLVTPIYGGVDIAMGVLFSVLLGFVGMLLGLGLAVTIGYFVPQRMVETERVELAAIQDNIVTKGRFFLGSGSMDGVPKFFFYGKADGGYQLRSLDVIDAVIVEGHDKPELITYVSLPVPDWLSLFAQPYKRRDEFRIPSGSLVKNFTLDAK